MRREWGGDWNSGEREGRGQRGGKQASEVEAGPGRRQEKGGGGGGRGGKDRERIWVGKGCEVMGRGGKDCEMMGRRQEEKGGKATGDGYWTKGGGGG